MLLLLPVLSWAGADVLITANQQAQWVSLPPEMYAPLGIVSIQIPEVKKPLQFGLGSLRLGVIIFTGVFLFIGVGLYSMVYAIFYRFMAPPRYQGFDSPPVGPYRPDRDLYSRSRRK
jgi:hypothetical protein